MNRHKKRNILACAFLTALSIAACRRTAEVEPAASQQRDAVSAMEQRENSSPTMKQQENNVPAVEYGESETTAEELLDLFINGSISAVYSTDLTSSYSVMDLNMDSEEWDSCSVGEKVDLDNDGENELIINGPYGGKYLDARDNKVYEFAAGGGTALTLSYVSYNGAVWILYSNNMNAGYKCYHMYRFEGADHLAAEITFSEELVDQNDAESKMEYTWNGTTVSYDEYTELCSKIFVSPVNTN